MSGYFFEGLKNAAAMGGASFRGPELIGIEDTRQSGVFGLMYDSEMIPAKGAGADYGDAGFGHFSRKRLSGFNCV